MPNLALRKRAGALAAFERLSFPKQAAVLELFFAIPRHQSCLQAYQVRVSSLRSLEGDGLARLTFLQEVNGAGPMPFWTLTQRGQELARAARNSERH